MARPQAVTLTYPIETDWRMIGIGLAILLLGLVIAVPTESIGLGVFAVLACFVAFGLAKRGKKCPSCRTRISVRAGVCPQCHTATGWSRAPAPIADAHGGK